MMRKLTDNEIHAQMGTIQKAWTLKGNFIHREFVFENFREAFSFMTSVALLAEKQDHHPDWSNVYKKVRIGLSTHEVGGLSEKDFKLAAEIDRLME